MTAVSWLALGPQSYLIRNAILTLWFSGWTFHCGLRCDERSSFALFRQNYYRKFEMKAMRSDRLDVLLVYFEISIPQGLILAKLKPSSQLGMARRQCFRPNAQILAKIEFIGENSKVPSFRAISPMFFEKKKRCWSRSCGTASIRLLSSYNFICSGNLFFTNLISVVGQLSLKLGYFDRIAVPYVALHVLCSFGERLCLREANFSFIT